MPTSQQQINALLQSKLHPAKIEAVDELIFAVCASACDIEAARQQNNIPPTIPAPWPESTWKFRSIWTQAHHAS